MMRKKISLSSNFKFIVKINKTKNSDIMIGIVDRSKQLSARKSSNSGNAVCYRGKNSTIYYGEGSPKSKISGIGFFEG